MYLCLYCLPENFKVTQQGLEDDVELSNTTQHLQNQLIEKEDMNVQYVRNNKSHTYNS